jgi:hypothetical protein
MPWGFAAAAVGSVAGSLISADASKSAAAKQSEAAERAARLQPETAQAQIPVLQGIYGNNYNYLNNLYNANVQQGMPYQYLGTSGANQLQDLTNSGYFSKQFGPQDLQSNLAPNYEFMKNQGLGAVTQQLNVGGGGSNIVRGATKFAEDYASNAYQNAFNNFQTQRTGIYNTLSGIANIGLNANTIQGSLANSLAGNQTTLGNQLGTSITNLATGGSAAAASGITGSAIANASGQVGAANAISSGIGNAGNSILLSQLLAPKTAPATGSTPVSQTGIYNPSGSGISVGGTPVITTPA